jgi:hypothetical protein
MVQLPKIKASSEEIKILRLGRKKKVLSIRDANFWACEELMHKGALNKFFPKKGRGAGWPHYILTRRAHKLLEYVDANPRHK